MKLSLEVLPILELPFVWEMNSKLIKKNRQLGEGRGMGLGTSLRFFYSEAKMVRKLRGSPPPGPQGGQHTEVSPTRLGPGGVLTMASPPFTAVGKNLGNKIASLNPVCLAAAQSSFLQNNSNYQIIIPDGSSQSEN